MPIHRKTRPNARMQRLTPLQKDSCFAHCETTPVREAVRWIKAQFNITISKSSLSAWLREQRIERSMSAELAALRDNHYGASLVSDVAGASTPITVANSVLFASAVFNEFKKSPAERDENRLVRYMDLALKARDLEIRASAVQLSFERYRSDAARKPANCPSDPQSLAESYADEREKIEKAMLLVFGEEPARFVSKTGLPVAETESQQLARSRSQTECQ
jgi:hypothetical protein